MKAAAVALLSVHCLFAFGAPATAGSGPAPVRTTRIVAGLSHPTFVTHAPADTARLFVLEKRGAVRIVDLASGELLAAPFLDIDDKVLGGANTFDEQGLLGIAFHPDYATSGCFFVYYTAVDGTDTIERYSVSASDPNVADASSGLVALSWPDPFSNHNGGWMDFGPDGSLYVSVGDGGSSNDPGNRAQTLEDMKLGKILRIAPDVTDRVPPHYAIPSGNPFIDQPGDDEIWHYGLRNPWRCSFDRATGDLWIADVGQNAIEEINVALAGESGLNFGWRCMEGQTCTGLAGCECDDILLADPILTYPHGAGTAAGFCITGGYVYRGCAYPELDGAYFYADFTNNNVWSLRYDRGMVGDLQLRNDEISPSIEGFAVNQIASFGEDANGELYIVDHGSTTGGQIFKIIPDAGERTCVVTNPADVNGDALVDGADLSILLGGWGQSGPGDLDGSGSIDAADLAAILGAWTG